VFLAHTRSIVTKLQTFMLRSATEPAPVFTRALQAAEAAEQWTIARLPHGSLTALFDGRVVAGVAAAMLGLLRYLNERSRDWDGYVPRITDSWDVLMMTLTVACVLYILAFTGVPLVMWSTGSSPEEAAGGAKTDTWAAVGKVATFAPTYDVPTSVTFASRKDRDTGSPARNSSRDGIRSRRGGMAE
jgi:hypothetical protein